MNSPLAIDTADPAAGLITGWALTSGNVGNEIQCLGVLEAMGLVPEVKRVWPGKAFRAMAPWGPAAPDSEVAPPWPDLLVASSRQAIPYARMIRRKSRGHTFVAIMQDPKVSPDKFDLVWVNEHDRLSGSTVLSTLTAPHRLTEERLSREAELIADQVADLPGPLIAVLVGGSSSAYSFRQDDAVTLADEVAAFAARHSCSLLVTPSRRTGPSKRAILRERLADTPGIVWDGASKNPYFAFLGHADAVIATCDSVNMIGEAAFTGKPIYAYPLRGGSAKFRRFHQGMEQHGAMRWFDGGFDRWTYATLDATTLVADEIRWRMAARAVASTAQ